MFDPATVQSFAMLVFGIGAGALIGFCLRDGRTYREGYDAGYEQCFLDTTPREYRSRGNVIEQCFIDTAPLVHRKRPAEVIQLGDEIEKRRII